MILSAIRNIVDTSPRFLSLAPSFYVIHGKIDSSCNMSHNLQKRKFVACRNTVRTVGDNVSVETEQFVCASNGNRSEYIDCCCDVSSLPEGAERRDRRQESINRTEPSLPNTPPIIDLTLSPVTSFCVQRPDVLRAIPIRYPAEIFHPQPFSIGSTFLNSGVVTQNLLSAYFHRHTSINSNSPKEGQGKRRKQKGDIPGYVESLRSWEDIKQSKGKGTTMTIMCYNVLAQDLLEQHPHIYRSHNKNHLGWNTRWQNLLQEIKQFKADIMCLQEVQESHITNYYSSLETLGYKGIYKKKTGMKVDGCAIYYSTNKFNLIEHTSVEYYQNNINVLNRDNVGLVAKFSSKGNKKEFIVATTHLLYNPRRQDVRVAQLQMLLAEVERMAYDKTTGTYVPVIITGDFNSKPGTALYKLVSEGRLRYEHLSERQMIAGAGKQTGKLLVPPWLKVTDNCQHEELIIQRNKGNKLSRVQELELLGIQHTDRKKRQSQPQDISLYSSGTLSHVFPLKSVYTHGNKDNPEGTTYQEEWITVDYIFYSGKKDGGNFQDDNLVLLSRYKLPTSKELGNVRIPNSSLGSDHLSLVARFLLK